MGAAVRVAALACLAVVAFGCAAPVVPVPGSAGPAPVGPLGFGDLQIANGTTIPVTLIVDGVARIDVPPRAWDGLRAAELPPKPWSVTVRHAVSGRVLLTLRVLEDPTDDGVRQQGAAARADLSCGRIDVWVGPPMVGPIPGPGRSRHCDP